MRNLIERLGIQPEHLVPREQLKQILGGADLHCRCHGSVGCWTYPGVTAENGGNDINANQEIAENCSSGAGMCAYQDLCARA